MNSRLVMDGESGIFEAEMSNDVISWVKGSITNPLKESWDSKARAATTLQPLNGPYGRTF